MIVNNDYIPLQSNFLMKRHHSKKKINHNFFEKYKTPIVFLVFIAIIGTFLATNVDLGDQPLAKFHEATVTCGETITEDTKLIGDLTGCVGGEDELITAAVVSLKVAIVGGVTA